VEVVASLSQGRTAAAQCGLFTHKSVPVIFEPPCICQQFKSHISGDTFLSEYPNHLLHHVNSDHFYLSAHYTCIIPSLEQRFLIVYTSANKLAGRPQCAINSILTAHLTKTLKKH